MKIHTLFPIFFFLVIGRLSAQPLLTCTPSSEAAFEVYTGEAASCLQACPSIFVQGMPVNSPCVEHSWFLNDTPLAGEEGNSTFCYGLTGTGPYTLRHELRRMQPDSQWHTQVAECVLPALPCCGGPEAAFTFTISSIDSSGVPLLADVQVQYTGTGAAPQQFTFKNAGTVLYDDSTLPSLLEDVPFGRSYDRLCLTVEASVGCESTYCLKIEDAIAAQREAPPGDEAVERKDQSCVLYPNPTSGILHIQYTGAPAAELSLYQSTGMLALQQSISSDADNVIALHHLPAGIYTAVVTQNGAILCKELVEVMR